MNFTPGPSQPFFTVRDHLRTWVKKNQAGVPADSDFLAATLYDAAANLRDLLSIPDDYSIFFTDSADRVRERIFHDLVAERSAHLVNGVVSKRFYDAARIAGRRAGLFELAEGAILDHPPTLDPGTELLAITHDEYSKGITIPAGFIRRYADEYPEVLIAIDASTSLPYAELPYEQVDTVFFEVHFGFGLPAGLAVWAVSPRCVEKAGHLKKRPGFVGAFMSLSNLHMHSNDGRIPGYPNLLGLFLLKQVTRDLLSRGIATIRRETDYKSALLYHLLERHPLMQPVVNAAALRSKTVIAANCNGHHQQMVNTLRSGGFVAGDGMGPDKGIYLRFANFPVHSKEQFERLIDILEVTEH